MIRYGSFAVPKRYTLCLLYSFKTNCEICILKPASWTRCCGHTRTFDQHPVFGWAPPPVPPCRHRLRLICRSSEAGEGFVEVCEILLAFSLTLFFWEVFHYPRVVTFNTRPHKALLFPRSQLATGVYDTAEFALAISFWNNSSSVCQRHYMRGCRKSRFVG